ncbi:MAG TPA: TIGR00159 family protein [Firmicutes bacterium]|jgi:diadenylate cyclase|nr:TIGR00159 family protein [Bacillota bacterium]
MLRQFLREWVVEMLAQLFEGSTYQILALFVDLILVTIVLYRVLSIFAGTRAIAVINGLIMIIAISVVARMLGLSTLYWLLQKGLTAVTVALPIVFQPELRRGLERLGAYKGLAHWLPWIQPKAEKVSAEHIAEAAFRMQRQHIGALMVLRGQMPLADIVDTGIQLDAKITTELICQVFVPNSPLHDGAAIISESRIVAAACLLPLSDNNKIDKNFGTRHRAALGLSEVSDALVIVVSEETGRVSLAKGGELQRIQSSAELVEKLGGIIDKGDPGDPHKVQAPLAWPKWWRLFGGDGR